MPRFRSVFSLVFAYLGAAALTAQPTLAFVPACTAGATFATNATVQFSQGEQQLCEAFGAQDLAQGFRANQSLNDALKEAQGDPRAPANAAIIRAMRECQALSKTAAYAYLLNAFKLQEKFFKTEPRWSDLVIRAMRDPAGSAALKEFHQKREMAIRRTVRRLQDYGFDARRGCAPIGRDLAEDYIARYRNYAAAEQHRLRDFVKRRDGASGPPSRVGQINAANPNLFAAAGGGTGNLRLPEPDAANLRAATQGIAVTAAIAVIAKDPIKAGVYLSRLFARIDAHRNAFAGALQPNNPETQKFLGQLYLVLMRAGVGNALSSDDARMISKVLLTLFGNKLKLHVTAKGVVGEDQPKLSILSLLAGMTSLPDVSRWASRELEMASMTKMLTGLKGRPLNGEVLMGQTIHGTMTGFDPAAKAQGHQGVLIHFLEGSAETRLFVSYDQKMIQKTKGNLTDLWTGNSFIRHEHGERTVYWSKSGDRVSGWFYKARRLDRPPYDSYFRAGGTPALGTTASGQDILMIVDRKGKVVAWIDQEGTILEQKGSRMISQSPASEGDLTTHRVANLAPNLKTHRLNLDWWPPQYRDHPGRNNFYYRNAVVTCLATKAFYSRIYGHPFTSAIPEAVQIDDKIRIQAGNEDPFILDLTGEGTGNHVPLLYYHNTKYIVGLAKCSVDAEPGLPVPPVIQDALNLRIVKGAGQVLGTTVSGVFGTVESGIYALIGVGQTGYGSTRDFLGISADPCLDQVRGHYTLQNTKLVAWARSFLRGDHDVTSEPAPRDLIVLYNQAAGLCPAGKLDQLANAVVKKSRLYKKHNPEYTFIQDSQITSEERAEAAYLYFAAQGLKNKLFQEGNLAMTDGSVGSAFLNYSGALGISVGEMLVTGQAVGAVFGPLKMMMAARAARAAIGAADVEGFLTGAEELKWLQGTQAAAYFKGLNALESWGFNAQLGASAVSGAGRMFTGRTSDEILSGADEFMESIVSIGALGLGMYQERQKQLRELLRSAPRYYVPPEIAKAAPIDMRNGTATPRANVVIPPEIGNANPLRMSGGSGPDRNTAGTRAPLPIPPALANAPPISMRDNPDPQGGARASGPTESATPSRLNPDLAKAANEYRDRHPRGDTHSGIESTVNNLSSRFGVHPDVVRSLLDGMPVLAEIDLSGVPPQARGAFQRMLAAKIIGNGGGAADTEGARRWLNSQSDLSGDQRAAIWEFLRDNNYVAGEFELTLIQRLNAFWMRFWAQKNKEAPGGFLSSAGMKAALKQFLLLHKDLADDQLREFLDQLKGTISLSDKDVENLMSAVSRTRRNDAAKRNRAETLAQFVYRTRSLNPGEALARGLEEHQITDPALIRKLGEMIGGLDDAAIRRIAEKDFIRRAREMKGNQLIQAFAQFIGDWGLLTRDAVFRIADAIGLGIDPGKDKALRSAAQDGFIRGAKKLPVAEKIKALAQFLSGWGVTSRGIAEQIGQEIGLDSASIWEAARDAFVARTQFHGVENKIKELIQFLSDWGIQSAAEIRAVGEASRLNPELIEKVAWDLFFARAISLDPSARIRELSRFINDWNIRRATLEKITGINGFTRQTVRKAAWDAFFTRARLLDGSALTAEISNFAKEWGVSPQLLIDELRNQNAVGPDAAINVHAELGRAGLDKGTDLYRSPEQSRRRNARASPYTDPLEWAMDHPNRLIADLARRVFNNLTRLTATLKDRGLTMADLPRVLEEIHDFDRTRNGLTPKRLLRAKYDALTALGFTREQAVLILRLGICGPAPEAVMDSIETPPSGDPSSATRADDHAFLTALLKDLRDIRQLPNEKRVILAGKMGKIAEALGPDFAPQVLEAYMALLASFDWQVAERAATQLSDVINALGATHAPELVDFFSQSLRMSTYPTALTQKLRNIALVSDSKHADLITDMALAGMRATYHPEVKRDLVRIASLSDRLGTKSALKILIAGLQDTERSVRDMALKELIDVAKYHGKSSLRPLIDEMLRHSRGMSEQTAWDLVNNALAVKNIDPLVFFQGFDGWKTLNALLGVRFRYEEKAAPIRNVLLAHMNLVVELQAAHFNAANAHLLDVAARFGPEGLNSWLDFLQKTQINPRLDSAQATADANEAARLALSLPEEDRLAFKNPPSNVGILTILRHPSMTHLGLLRWLYLSGLGNPVEREASAAALDRWLENGMKASKDLGQRRTAMTLILLRHMGFLPDTLWKKMLESPPANKADMQALHASAMLLKNQMISEGSRPKLLDEHGSKPEPLDYQALYGGLSKRVSQKLGQKLDMDVDHLFQNHDFMAALDREGLLSNILSLSSFLNAEGLKSLKRLIAELAASPRKDGRIIYEKRYDALRGQIPDHLLGMLREYSAESARSEESADAAKIDWGILRQQLVDHLGRIHEDNMAPLEARVKSLVERLRGEPPSNAIAAYLKSLDSFIPNLRNILSALANDQPPSPDALKAVMHVLGNKKLALDLLPQMTEIFNDLKNISAATQRQKSAAATASTFHVTDDPALMLSMGNDPIPTCQRCTDASGHNQGGEPINRLLVGWTFMAYWESPSLGRYARALVLVGKDANGKPAIMIDRIYTAPGVAIDKAMMQNDLIAFGRKAKVGHVYFASADGLGGAGWTASGLKSTDYSLYGTGPGEALPIYLDTYRPMGTAPAIKLENSMSAPARPKDITPDLRKAFPDELPPQARFPRDEHDAPSYDYLTWLKQHPLLGEWARKVFSEPLTADQIKAIEAAHKEPGLTKKWATLAKAFTEADQIFLLLKAGICGEVPKGIALSKRPIVEAQRPPPSDIHPHPAWKPTTGATLEGGYTLGNSIGEGGFAVLFRATDRNGRERAIKFAETEEPETRPAAEKLLLAEYHVLRELGGRWDKAGFEGPAPFPRVHELGRTSDGKPYIVMDLIPGKNLYAWFKSAPLNPREAMRCMLHVLDALRFLHQNHSIHRDINPNNIMMTNDGHVVLVDFGLASDTHGRVPPGTEKYQTKLFAAPEANEGVFNARTDIYSAGKTLEDVMDRAYSFAMRMDPAIQAVVDKATAKDPAARYQNVDEMIHALLNAERHMDMGDSPSSRIPPFADRSQAAPQPKSRSPREAEDRFLDWYRDDYRKQAGAAANPSAALIAYLHQHPEETPLLIQNNQYVGPLLQPSAGEAGLSLYLEALAAQPVHTWSAAPFVDIGIGGGNFELNPGAPLELGYHGTNAPSYHLIADESGRRVFLADETGRVIATAAPGQTIEVGHSNGQRIVKVAEFGTVWPNGSSIELRIRIPERAGTVMLVNTTDARPMVVGLKKDVQHITGEYRRGWSRTKTIWRKIGAQENIVTDPDDPRLEPILTNVRSRIRSRRHGKEPLSIQEKAQQVLELVKSAGDLARVLSGIDVERATDALASKHKNLDVNLMDAVCDAAGGVCRHKTLEALWLLDRVLPPQAQLHVMVGFGHICAVVEDPGAPADRRFWVVDPSQQKMVFPLSDATKTYTVNGVEHRYSDSFKPESPTTGPPHARPASVEPQTAVLTEPKEQTLAAPGGESPETFKTRQTNRGIRRLLGYDEDGVFNPKMASFPKELLSLTPLNGRKVLDVGTGHGDFVFDMRRLGVDATGFDRKLTPNLKSMPDTFTEGEADQLLHRHYASDSFDALYYNWSVFLVVKGDACRPFLEQAAHIVKPGGDIRISGIDPKNLPVILREMSSLGLKLNPDLEVRPCAPRDVPPFRGVPYEFIWKGRRWEGRPFLDLVKLSPEEQKKHKAPFVDSGVLTHAAKSNAAARQFMASHPIVFVTDQHVVEVFDLRNVNNPQEAQDLLERLSRLYEESPQIKMQSVFNIPFEQVSSYLDCQERLISFFKENKFSDRDSLILADVVLQSRGRVARFATLSGKAARVLEKLKSQPIQTQFHRLLVGFPPGFQNLFLPEPLLISAPHPASNN